MMWYTYNYIQYIAGPALANVLLFLETTYHLLLRPLLHRPDIALVPSHCTKQVPSQVLFNALPESEVAGLTCDS